MLRPGDVVRIFDRETRPEKVKRHICISLTRQLFLRINSRLSTFGPSFQLLVADCDFLEHDSYVELNALVRNSQVEIVKAELLGRLTAEVTVELEAVIVRVRTLTNNDKDMIREAFFGPDGPAHGLRPKRP
jgi:hypothetical protein